MSESNKLRQRCQSPRRTVHVQEHTREVQRSNCTGTVVSDLKRKGTLQSTSSNTGSPTWWKPEYTTTVTPPEALGFNVTLVEDVGSGNAESNKVVTAEVNQLCQNEACTYRIKFTFTNPGYFTVLVNGKE